jgi:hypothetical protein
MAYGRVSSLKFIEGIIGTEMSKEVFKQHMLPYAQKLLGRKYIFPHNCEPKHAAKQMKAFLEKKKHKVL